MAVMFPSTTKIKLNRQYIVSIYLMKRLKDSLLDESLV